MTRLFDLAQISPEEFTKGVAECPAVAIAVGTIEWHGNHLPLGFDTLKAHALCQRIAEQVGCFLAPPLFYGYAYHFYQKNLMPAMYCNLDAFREYLRSIIESFFYIGFRVIFILSGHYENLQMLAIRTAAQTVMDDIEGLSVICHSEDEYTVTEGYHGDHAGTYETSLGMALLGDMTHPYEAPEQTRMGSSTGLGENLTQIIVRKASAEIRHALANPGWSQPKSWVPALEDIE